MKDNIITQSIPGGFSVIASGFIMESLEHMIPWLIVSFSVVVCDLAFGIRKSDERRSAVFQCHTQDDGKDGDVLRICMYGRYDKHRFR